MTDIVSTTSNTDLLNKHGHIMLNEFRTIRQAWDRLNITPYHHSKAHSYSMLRRLMLKEHEREENE